MKDNLIISVDLGGTNLKFAILDSKYKIIQKMTLRTQGFANPQELIQIIIKYTQELVKHYTSNKKGVLGLGVGVPGPVDIQKGIVHFLPNIPGWENVRLVQVLNQRMGLSVRVDNDANLFTLAEFCLGAGKGFKNVVGITLGTGVGGGLVLKCKLYRGEGFVAGEIGHIPVVMQGRRCNCGGRGCLEAYVGNQKILTQAKTVFKKSISLKKLSALAANGNRRAIGIWQAVGHFLGVALTGVVNLLNPDVIVIGGGVANTGKVLFDSIKKTIQENAMSVQAKHVRIFKSKFGENAGLIGAAILVKEQL